MPATLIELELNTRLLLDASQQLAANSDTFMTIDRYLTLFLRMLELAMAS